MHVAFKKRSMFQREFLFQVFPSLTVFCHVFNVFSIEHLPEGRSVQISLGNAFSSSTFLRFETHSIVQGSEQYCVQGTCFVLPHTAFPKFRGLNRTLSGISPFCIPPPRLLKQPISFSFLQRILWGCLSQI